LYRKYIAQKYNIYIRRVGKTMNLSVSANYLPWLQYQQFHPAYGIVLGSGENKPQNASCACCESDIRNTDDPSFDEVILRCYS
jgi:hypothetical protein